MAAEGNGDPPVPDLRTMEELCLPSLNGRGGPIALIAIQAMNFELKNDMIQQVRNSCQFHGLLGDDANKHLDKFLHVTQSIKVNGVTDDTLRLYIFPHSLTHHATAWFDHLPRNSINTFEEMAKMFLGKYFLPSMVTKLRNEITNFHQRPDESLFEAWERYKLSIDRCPNQNMLPVTQIDTFYSGLTLRHRDTINATAGGTFMKKPLKAKMAKINKNLMRVLQVNQQVKAVTPSSETCGGPHSFNDFPTTVRNTQSVYAMGAYQVEHKTEVTKDMVYPINNRSTEDVQPPVVLTESPILNSDPFISPIIEPVSSPVSALRPDQRPLIPYPSRLHDQKLQLVDRLISRPVGVVENVFVKVGTFHFPANFVVVDFVADPRVALILERSFLKTGRALIDVFEEVDAFLALEDDRTSTKVDQSYVDTEGDILLLEAFLNDDPSLPPPNQRNYLPQVKKELKIFFENSFQAYLSYLEKMLKRCEDTDLCQNRDKSHFMVKDGIVLGHKISKNRIEVDKAKVDVIAKLPHPTTVKGIRSFLGHASFYRSDFLLEEVDAFLALEDDPTSTKVDQSYLDSEGDILLLEAFLNDDPSLTPLNQGNYLPEVHKELKICEAKSDKSSIDEPLKVELKDLPPHLEYAFLEGHDKLLVIIAKDLSVEEKTTLITVLKSHKQAIAWKLSDIKGIDPEFCTHKILMEEDFEPAVQH
uniref:Retrotransposon gag domain-containing protein n=1 Tax=Tanacetum cinerariifolium TaxID=118510 RepID=A0A699IB82_TANCI|nr:hypothetical protein [Tanacetum cinerariifolium]